VSSVLRPHQHSIGYTEDGFYRSKDPTNSMDMDGGSPDDVRMWTEDVRMRMEDVRITSGWRPYDVRMWMVDVRMTCGGWVSSSESLTAQH